MPLDYYTFKVTELSVVVLVVGALIGSYRIRRWPSAVQLLGAGCMATALAIGYLVPTHVDPKTLQLKLGAVWRTQELLSSGGLMLFAIAYTAERLSGRKGPN